MNASAIRFAAGNYGPRTTAAVEELQQSFGLPVTGVYDDTLRAQLVKMLQARREGCQRCETIRPSPTTRKTTAPSDVYTTLNYASPDPSGAPVPHRTLIRDARPFQEDGSLSLATHGFK